MDFIRKAATREDAGDLSRLAVRIWRDHYTSIIGSEQTEYMLQKFQSEEVIFNSIQNGMEYYMAFCNNVLCGYAAVKHIETGNTVFLSKLYVERQFREKGLSKKLLEEVYKFAAARNAKSIWLTCNKYNARTLDIYKKLGFEIIDQMETDIGEGYIMDDYMLERKLG